MTSLASALPPSPFLTMSPSPLPGVPGVPGQAGSNHNIVPFPAFGQCNKTYTKRDMSLALEALR